jgi:hypothetical protein
MAINDAINAINTGRSVVGAGLNAFDSLTGRGADGGKQKFSVQELKSKINSSKGVMRPNLFLAQVTNPICLAGDQAVSNFLCSSATLPGKMITIQQHKRLGYGTEDRRVTGAIMPDVTLTFYVGNDGQPLTYFNEWLQNLFYTNGTKGASGMSASSGAPLFTVGYRNQYITPIEIIMYDDTQTSYLKYTLHEAFPMQIGDVALAWSDNDSFSSVAINFTYRYYTLDTIPAPDVNTAESGGILSSIRNGLGTVNKLMNSPIARNAMTALNVGSAQKLF